MSGFLEYQADILHMDGMSLPDLAARYGTPLYVYSQAHMRDAAAAMDQALAGPTSHLLCYAVKANSSLAVIQTFAREGFGADVTSGGELYRALKAGVPPDRIVFSGVGKTATEMRQALEAPVKALHVESLSELETLHQVAAEMGVIAPLALRLNPDVDPHTHPKIATGLSHNKFGIPWQMLDRALAMLAELPALRLCGLAMHIGSQITDLDAYRDAARKLARLAGDVLASGLALDYLDFGGGLAVRYADETPPSPAEWGAALRAALGDLPLAVLVEPGRSLVAEAGLLLTRVLGVKDAPPKTFVIVDAGMNDLIRPMLYDAYHPIWPVTRAPGTKLREVDIVGPICETTDTFARERQLALPNAGDLLAILGAGAYGMSMTSNYNSRPRPAEVLICYNQSILLARQRETVADLVRGESLFD